MRLQITQLPLSFRTSKEMRHRLEMLPCGPEWKSMTLPTAHPSKSPPVLYMRDPIECLQSIFGNPYFDACQPDLGQSRTITDYSAIAERLKSGTIQGVRRPYRTFSVMTTAFHLSRDPSANMTFDEVMAKFAFMIYVPLLQILYAASIGREWILKQ